MDKPDTNIELVRAYLNVATPGRIQVDRLRGFLADHVTVEDSLMPAVGADAFIEAMTSAASASSEDESGGGMKATIQDVVGSDDGSPVAARILFEAGELTVQFSQWFWVEDGKITRIQVIYDPRPFLAAAS